LKGKLCLGIGRKKSSLVFGGCSRRKHRGSAAEQLLERDFGGMKRVAA